MSQGMEMKMSKISEVQTKSLFALLLAAVVLSGCAAAVVGGAAAVHDRRSVGNVIDDNGIEISVKQKIYNEAEINEDDHIKVVSNNGIVLLVGETMTEQNRKRATEIAQAVNGVRQVHNELGVRFESSFGGRFDDTYLNTKINTALLTKNPLPGFDPTRINVTTVRDIAYLMGLVTRDEGEAVADVVRNVGGIEKVVKVFEYID
jgi:osmotically-inducible protein OsmY